MMYFGTRPGMAGHYWFHQHMLQMGRSHPPFCKGSEPPVFGTKLWDWTLYHINGDTVLCCPGSIADTRPGSITCFYEEGVFGLKEMCDLVAQKFDYIWKEIPIKPEVSP